MRVACQAGCTCEEGIGKLVAALRVPWGHNGEDGASHALEQVYVGDIAVAAPLALSFEVCCRALGVCLVLGCSSKWTQSASCLQQEWTQQCMSRLSIASIPSQSC